MQMKKHFSFSFLFFFWTFITIILRRLSVSDKSAVAASEAKQLSGEFP